MNQKKFKNLNENEKKDFLSNDMAERIIRVEQNVSLRFGKSIPYTSTEYYKSLSSMQRKSFEKYLGKKKIKKSLLILLILVPIFFIFLLNVKFTGNVINENLNYNNSFNGFFIWTFIIILVIFGLYLNNKRIRNKKIDNYIKILDK